MGLELLTAIRHCHLRNRETVENVPVIIGDVVENQALAVIETDSETPLLPVHGVAIHGEGRAFGLLDKIRLQIRAEGSIQQVVCILNCIHWLPRLGFSCLVVCSTGQVVNPDQLLGVAVKNGAEFARKGIMIVFGVIHGNHVHEALEKPALLIGVIRAVHPRVIADGHARRELQLLDLCENGRMLHTELLNTGQLIDIHWGLQFWG